MARSWRWQWGRQRVTGSQAPNRLKPWEKYWLHSICGREICLSVVAVSLEGEGDAPAEKWPHLSWAGLLFLGTYSCFFVSKKNSCFWPFEKGRIVHSIFISLWCVCFASIEAGCHICHVCSGFYSLLLITLHRPHEGTRVCKHELASSCFI